MSKKLKKAPELIVDQWLNTEQPLSLAKLRGKVVLIEAFQMLCPGCVANGLPQAGRVAETFSPDDLVVIGLHTVFEHHDAMTPHALKAFLHEYRIRFPVAVDKPSATIATPQTMSAYAMQGTPTLVLIDRDGFIRRQVFSTEQDLRLGAEIMTLILERSTDVSHKAPAAEAGMQDCDDSGCPVPATR